MHTAKTAAGITLTQHGLGSINAFNGDFRGPSLSCGADGKNLDVYSVVDADGRSITVLLDPMHIATGARICELMLAAVPHARYVAYGTDEADDVASCQLVAKAVTNPLGSCAGTGVIIEPRGVDGYAQIIAVYIDETHEFPGAWARTPESVAFRAAQEAAWEERSKAAKSRRKKAAK